jgi:hypothetical protein
MPSEGSRGELSHPQKRIVNGFDDVAKGLAAGTISRGQALKLTGSALLGGGLLALFPGAAGAQQGGVRVGRPSTTGSVREPGVASTVTVAAPRPSGA